MVLLFHEILVSNKKEHTNDTQNKLDIIPDSYAEWEKANPKKLYIE